MLNNLDTKTFENSYSFSNEEIELVRQFILENQKIMKKDFEESLSENKLLVLINPTHVLIKENYLLAVKAIIVMKENWAKSLDEFDKYFSRKNNQIANNDKKIIKLKKEADKKQKFDRKEADILAEKIKNWSHFNDKI